ncbi:MAG: hypothetical protein HUK03_10240 [Bacteroidaceae bacterium]|nr:hypothetical protein [Bacteroidaceae bacterium]
MIKKEYTQPQIRVVMLHHRTNILVFSEQPVKIDECWNAEYADENEETY